MARRFAQPLGIHLDFWQGRVIAIDKGVVRLLPVSERSRQLFGARGLRPWPASWSAARSRHATSGWGLFAEHPTPTAPTRGRAHANVADDALGAAPGSTTLDRVHAAMLLQKSGRTNALRALLKFSRSSGPRACAWRTRCRGCLSTPRARRSGCWMRCCWRIRSRCESEMLSRFSRAGLGLASEMASPSTGRRRARCYLARQGRAGLALASEMASPSTGRRRARCYLAQQGRAGLSERDDISLNRQA